MENVKKKKLSLKKSSKSKPRKSITKGKLKNDEFKQTTMTDFFGIQNCNPIVDHNGPTGHTSSPDTLKYKKRNVSSNITPKKLSDIIPTQSTTSHTPLTYSRPVKPQTKSPALRKALFELNTSTDEHIDVFDSIDMSQLMCRVDGIDNNGLYQLPLVYIVTSVTKERHEEYGRWTEEQVLQLTRDNTTYECCLRDIWSQTDVRVGDVVHLLGDLLDPTRPLHISDHSQIVINEDNNSAIIVNPDYLVSSTCIASAGITCTRRAVMSEIYKGSSTNNHYILYGNLLHSLYQKFVVHCACSHGNALIAHEGLIKQYIQELLTHSSTLDQMYALDLTEQEVSQTMESFIPSITSWCQDYLSGGKMTGKMEVRKFWNKTDSKSWTNVDVSVPEVQDIEETVWSPRFGLKGKIDVTVAVQVKDTCNDTVFTGVSPLEVKTGKMTSKMGSIEHRAQVMLYCLMLSDVYSTNVPVGMLYYMKTNHTQLIPTATNEIKALLIARNHLARYHGNHWDHVTLPDMINERFTCQHCPLLKECTLHYRAFEDGLPSGSHLGSQFPSTVANISESHLSFFRHWFKLTVEEMTHSQEQIMKEHTIWKQSLVERERSGYCISNVVPGEVLTLPKDYSQGFRVQQEFIRETPLSYSTNLSVGDQIVVSMMSDTPVGVSTYQWGVAIGYIMNINQDCTYILLNLDKSVTNTMRSYCIDLRVTASTEGIGLTNIAELCSSDNESTPRDQRLRELIIDQVKPVFNPDYTSSMEGITHCLSTYQKEAIHKVLQSDDYSLILGMPGTGKTTVITHLVRILVSLGRSVLITSFTNSAVDNILQRLLNEGIEFIRVGSKSKVHPLIAPYSTAQLSEHAGSVTELKHMYTSKLVVASTCHGINHAIFTHRRSFDFCIIDEAGQIPLPLSIGPIRLANVFVLVGDHYQLPPLVASPIAKAGGYDVSLFKLLCESQPSALVTLTSQYRMNQTIMNICNRLIYHGQLQCASDEVAMGTLDVPRWPLAMAEIHDEWMKTAIDPSVQACFLNTSKCSDSEELQTGGIVTNEYEAHVVCRIVNTLIKYGVHSDHILVLTQYKHQQRLILKLLGNGSTEVLTIDKCQGRDRPCVLLSFVRSNPDGKVGHLLSNWQRINVALTRAKHKLLMIGCIETLLHSECMRMVLNTLQEQSKIIDLTEL